MTAVPVLYRELGRALIRKGEGRRLFAYDDLTGQKLEPPVQLRGKVTVGWGRNLTDKGLSAVECDVLLGNDLDDAIAIAADYLGQDFWPQLDPVRQAVLIDMAHNLGARGLGGFVRLRRAILARDWDAAVLSMKESLWHRQVKGRAVYLEQMMADGQDRTYQATGAA